MTLVIEKSWRDTLLAEIEKPYISDLKKFLEREKSEGRRVFPPLPEVFQAFLLTPFEKVKVVIMGQDPYHGEGQAHGLSFSVKPGVEPPPSLKNIFKELKQDVGIATPSHGFLGNWAKQGVLLLNATLTVREKEPKSHFGMGWEQFTDAVIEKLSEREDPIVFLLWGKSAEEKCIRILSQKTHPHLVLKAAHPSPFSVTGFLGCRHFSKTNVFLESVSKEPIDWSL